MEFGQRVFMSATNLHIESLLEHFGHERQVNYSLDRFRSALTAAGSPERNVKSLVIAGTNGKGSVSLLTTAGLVKSGRTVATYMSPHLQSVTERFLLNGKPIAEAALSQLGNRYFGFAKEHGLSYFEFLTLLFFIWVKEVEVDVAVLEVGLGGRLDATNVTTPLACAVTSIDYDHMAILGNTLEEILLEKLGVVPNGGTLVSGITQPELQSKAQEWCKERRTRFIPNGKAITATGNRDWTGQELAVGDLKFRITNPNPRWVENANTAYGLLKTAFPTLEDRTIAEAFSDTRFPGRFETVHHNPQVILSGDHNPAGIVSLLETIKSLPPKKIHTLCAFSLDKPYREMFDALKEISTTTTLTSFPKQGDLPPIYRCLTTNNVEDPRLALDMLLRNVAKDEVILVTGSLYLVGALRQ